MGNRVRDSESRKNIGLRTRSVKRELSDAFCILLFAVVLGKRPAVEAPCLSPDRWRFVLIRFTKHRRNGTEGELLAFL